MEAIWEFGQPLNLRLRRGKLQLGVQGSLVCAQQKQACPVGVMRWAAGVRMARTRLGRGVAMTLEKAFVPNLIFLGTAKSGTTSLFEWLSIHPDIGRGSTKETRFLMDAEEPLARPDGYAKTGLGGYEAYFPDQRSNPKPYWLDVTPTYYYQRAARDVISSLEEKPYLGMIFRRPGPRIYSFYQYALNNQNVLPKTMTFEGFLAAVEEGPSGPLRKHPMLSNLYEHSDYAKYAEMWLQRVPREKMMFLTFEELVHDPRMVMGRLCDWLALDGSFYDNVRFAQENRSYVVRAPRLHRWMRRSAGRIPLPRAIKRPLRSLYEWVNTSELRRESSERTAELIADLDHRFAPSVKRLEDITGLDLTAWRSQSRS